MPTSQARSCTPPPKRSLTVPARTDRHRRRGLRAAHPGDTSGSTPSSSPPGHRDAGALLPHHFTLARSPFTWDGERRRFVSVALSRGFPRVDLSTTSPCDVRTFLKGLGLRGYLTCEDQVIASRRCS